MKTHWNNSNCNDGCDIKPINFKTKKKVPYLIDSLIENIYSSVKLLEKLEDALLESQVKNFVDGLGEEFIEWRNDLLLLKGWLVWIKLFSKPKGLNENYYE